MIIESWFLNKNFTQNERLVIECAEKEIVEETEKAVKVEFISDYGVVKSWIPKSVISRVTYKKGTGKMIKLKTGEIKEIISLNGNLVKTIDGKSYLKFAVEFI